MHLSFKYHIYRILFNFSLILIFIDKELEAVGGKTLLHPAHGGKVGGQHPLD